MSHHIMPWTNLWRGDWGKDMISMEAEATLQDLPSPANFFSLSLFLLFSFIMPLFALLFFVPLLFRFIYASLHTQPFEKLHSKHLFLVIKYMLEKHVYLIVSPSSLLSLFFSWSKDKAQIAIDVKTHKMFQHYNLYLQ